MASRVLSGGIAAALIAAALIAPSSASAQPAEAAPPATTTAEPAPTKTAPRRGVAVAAPATATAEPEGAPAAAAELAPRRRALAIAAAVGPGLIIHGAGSWVAERPGAARRLAATQALGLGLVLAGGLPILATYGSPKVTMPGVPLAVTGVGVFVGGWLGDIWSAAGGDEGGGVPRAERPRSFEAGFSWARDDYYGDRGYLELAAAWHLGPAGRLALVPRLRAAGDGSSGEGGLDGRWRLWGAAPSGEVIECGHRLELRLGAFGRADRDDEIGALWQELEVIGRADLRALDAALGGLFFEAGAGMALDQTRYPTGSGHTWDWNSLLLARTSLGAYLGRGRGEVALSYDHRRDDLVGGAFAGRAAGFLGHVGAEAKLELSRGYGLRVSVEMGTALLTTIALRYGELP